MTKFHIKDDGEPGRCEAAEGNCPLGGEHFSTPDAAREAYEADMKDMAILTMNHDENFERKDFFNENNMNNYTLIDTDTGSVFSANSVVMEAPENEEFYDSHERFIDDEKYKPVALVEATDLSLYNRPVVVERDTGLVVGVRFDGSNIHAIDHSKEIVDYDEILESQAAAAEAADLQGFKIWG